MVPWKTVCTLASAAVYSGDPLGSAIASEESWAYDLPPPISWRCTAMKWSA